MSGLGGAGAEGDGKGGFGGSEEVGEARGRDGDLWSLKVGMRMNKRMLDVLCLDEGLTYSPVGNKYINTLTPLLSPSTHLELWGVGFLTWAGMSYS